MKAKDLWWIMTVEEETPDEWGRVGRGLPWRYFNHDYEDKEYISMDEYNKKVKEFEDWILNRDPNLTQVEDNWITYKMFQKMFKK